MGFLAWIVVGAIAGFLAKRFTRTEGGVSLLTGARRARAA
jgi:uncharacterized membrane protein YeaQ/YmgE (transglycosylase-associated protein family)